MDNPKKPYKAIAAAIGTGIATFVGIWVADTDPFTAKEIASALVTSGVSAGAIGGLTFGVRNPKV